MRGPFIRCVIVATLVLLGCCHAALAEILHESALLGQTGFFHGSGGPGAGLYTDQYLGSAFRLNEPAVVDAIGGHLNGGGTLFGAIVSLPSFGSFPSAPFDDTLRAAVVFSPPGFSADVRVPLSVSLPAGDYAVIFGSGQFGALGSGGMFYNGTPLPDQSLFFWNTQQWLPLAPPGYRFVVTGTIVPEPSAIVAMLGFAASIFRLSKRKGCH